MSIEPEDDHRLAMYRRLLDNVPAEWRETFVNAAFLAGLSHEDCIRLLARPTPTKPGANLLLDTIESLESARQSSEKAQQSHEAGYNRTLESLKKATRALEKSTERAN